MNLEDCYCLLELDAEAGLAEVKSSYRRLARRYHPDLNPGDIKAEKRFVAIAQAYQILAARLPPAAKPAATANERTPEPETVPADRAPSPRFREDVPLSLLERQLKHRAYEQLQELLRVQNFPRAIAIAEGLARRLPRDVEARQWQAIAYERWGRSLIESRQHNKARLFLQKALRTDPKNRSLWEEVSRDFRRLEASVRSHPAGPSGRSS